MRIIGGTFKGIKLFEAFDKNPRPLKDLVKESILNILEYSKDSKIDLNNSLVLDLFAGTGSLVLSVFQGVQLRFILLKTTLNH